MVRNLYRNLSGKLRDEHISELVRGSGSTFLVRIIGLIAGYLFTLLISRKFGSDILGAHALSVTVLMIFTILGRMGMDFNIVKHFARYSQDHKWESVREVYAKTLKVVIPVNIALTLIFYFASPLIAANIFHKPNLEPYFKILSFAVLPMVMRYINAECYRGFRMHLQYAYSQNVSYFLYGTIVLGICTAFSSNPLLPNIAFLTALLILAFSSTLLIRKKIESHGPAVSELHTPSGLFRESFPMMLSGSLLLISGWINTILLGIFSTQTEVGIYSVVLKISAFSSFVLMSINAVSAPRFAQFYALGDTAGLKRYTRHTAKLIFFTSIPVFVGIVFFRDWLLGLFGPEFILGSAALLITMLGQLFNVFAGSVGHFLNMTGHQRVFRNIVALSTLVNILLCLWLIPDYGLMGSAIAGMAFMACWNISAMIYIRRKLGIRTFYWPFSA